MPESKRPLKVFLCHSHADSASVRASWWLSSPVLFGVYRNHARLTTLALAGSAREDGVDVWLDKEKLLPGQGFDRLNLSDWELEIRKA